MTRLVRGIGFALGLLRAAPQIGRQLVEVRDYALAETLRAAAKDGRDNSVPFFRLVIEVNARIPLAELTAALITGITLTTWEDWHWAAVPVLLILCASACYRRIRALTTMIIPPERRAHAARRRTRRRLSRLTWAGYICLHGRAIPGTEDVVDHLVIGPTGVHVLGSQWLDRRLPVRMSAGEPLYHGPESRNDLLLDVRRQAARVSMFIGSAPGAPAAVRAGLVIYGPSVWAAVPLRKVDVLGPRKLRKWLRGGPCELSVTEIQQLTVTIAKIFPPASAMRHGRGEPIPASRGAVRADSVPGSSRRRGK